MAKAALPSSAPPLHAADNETAFDEQEDVVTVGRVETGVDPRLSGGRGRLNAAVRAVGAAGCRSN